MKLFLAFGAFFCLMVTGAEAQDRPPEEYIPVGETEWVKDDGGKSFGVTCVSNQEVALNLYGSDEDLWQEGIAGIDGCKVSSDEENQAILLNTRIQKRNRVICYTSFEDCGFESFEGAKKWMISEFRRALKSGWCSN